MKKTVLLTIAILAAGLCWVGCNKAGKLNEISTFSPPSGPVELKLKWPAGQSIVQNIEVKMNMEITGQALPNPIKQDMIIGERYGLKVLNATADGGHEVEMEFLGMRLKLDQGGKTLLDYDSEKKSSTTGKDPTLAAMEKTFENVVGVKIHYFLDASNQVERIEGADELRSRLAAGGRSEAADSLKSMFTEQSLKQMISGQHLPPRPVQPGDSWPEQTDIAMGELGTMAMDTTFNFVRWETHGKRTCARLEFQGSMKSKPDQEPTTTRMSVSVLNGETSGVSWFDPELGTVIETTMNQDMDMKMTMPMPGRGKNAMQTLTNVMKQAINVKLESVK
jgi:hypothetical protein